MDHTTLIFHAQNRTDYVDLYSIRGLDRKKKYSFKHITKESSKPYLLT